MCVFFLNVMSCYGKRIFFFLIKSNLSKVNPLCPCIYYKVLHSQVCMCWCSIVVCTRNLQQKPTILSHFTTESSENSTKQFPPGSAGKSCRKSLTFSDKNSLTLRKLDSTLVVFIYYACVLCIVRNFHLPLKF